MQSTRGRGRGRGRGKRKMHGMRVGKNGKKRNDKEDGGKLQ